MSNHALETLSRLQKPVLKQSPDLERRIIAILSQRMPETSGWFHLLRYLIWPQYLMPVYYYQVGWFEVVIERHTSYWMLIITNAENAFLTNPFRALSPRKDAFIGLERKMISDENDRPTRKLEMHVDTEDELIAAIEGMLALML